MRFEKMKKVPFIMNESGIAYKFSQQDQEVAPQPTGMGEQVDHDQMGEQPIDQSDPNAPVEGSDDDVYKFIYSRKNALALSDNTLKMLRNPNIRPAILEVAESLAANPQIVRALKNQI